MFIGVAGAVSAGQAHSGSDDRQHAGAEFRRGLGGAGITTFGGRHRVKLLPVGPPYFGPARVGLSATVSFG